MKILLAFDSFKGSASSEQLSDAAEAAIRREIPACEIVKFPIADGGEGTTAAICSALDTKAVRCTVHDPLMRPIDVEYRVTGDTAIMEMAAASGLPLIEPAERNPELTTTFGTGEMILDAIEKGCKTIILGIGGSATNDAAIGMLTALGVKFTDTAGKPTMRLTEVVAVDDSRIDARLSKTRFIVACDVNNPLYGENGAACVFAPQKGADPEQVERLDAALRRFADLIKETKDIDLQSIAGAGAAGGMGGGMVAFLNAQLKSGIDTILEITGFDNALAGTDLVLTGEGCIDNQSGMGKAIGGIIAHASKAHVPVVAIGGGVAPDVDVNAMGLLAAFSIQQRPTTLEEAMKTENTIANVQRTVTQIIRLITCASSFHSQD